MMNKDIPKPVEIVPITTKEEVRTGDNLVQFTLRNAQFLAVYEYLEINDIGEKESVFDSYILLPKTESKHSSEVPTSWFYTGYIDDSLVIVAANAKQADTLNKEKKIQITGKVLDMPSQQLPNLVHEVLKLPGLSEYRDVPLVIDRYIDAKVVINEQPVKRELPFRIIVYMLVLTLLYVSLLRVLIIGYKAIRF
jgi:hypothetical protein